MGAQSQTQGSIILEESNESHSFHQNKQFEKPPKINEIIELKIAKPPPGPLTQDREPPGNVKEPRKEARMTFREQIEMEELEIKKEKTDLYNSKRVSDLREIVDTQVGQRCSIRSKRQLRHRRSRCTSQ